jgi:hypothetical protein
MKFANISTATRGESELRITYLKQLEAILMPAA